MCLKDGSPAAYIKAIDVHAHYGPYRKKEAPLLSQLLSSGIDTVAERAKLANTKITMVSPTAGLLPKGNSDPVSWNEKACTDIRKNPNLRFWVIVDPTTTETYAQARRMLKLSHCVGIKIHPEQHCYQISRYGEELIAFALEHEAVVLAHSGEENSMPCEYARLANTFPDVSIIAAHLGYSTDGNATRHVAAVQHVKHGNLYVDTSSSMSILSGLLEWAVEEIGSDQILYGTDSPLYFAPAHRTRINHAEISNTDKMKILRNNAVRVFGSTLMEE